MGTQSILENGLKSIYKLNKQLMDALVLMLKNISTNRFHPIFYLESPLPGGPESEGNKKLIRYKSKGHHTQGFETRDAAINSINNELVAQIKSIGYTPNLEIEIDEIWDGKGIPADQQIRLKTT